MSHNKKLFLNRWSWPQVERGMPQGHNFNARARFHVSHGLWLDRIDEIEQMVHDQIWEDMMELREAGANEPQ